jgi:hypothetical protein
MAGVIDVPGMVLMPSGAGLGGVMCVPRLHGSMVLCLDMRRVGAVIAVCIHPRGHTISLACMLLVLFMIMLWIGHYACLLVIVVVSGLLPAYLGPMGPRIRQLGGFPSDCLARRRPWSHWKP